METRDKRQEAVDGLVETLVEIGARRRADLSRLKEALLKDRKEEALAIARRVVGLSGCD